MYIPGPVAYAHLDHESDVSYTSNLECPYLELELQKMSNYGRKSAMLPLLTQQQHRAALIRLMGQMKNLLEKPIEMRELIENVLKENMK